MSTTMSVVDGESELVSSREVTIEVDEGIRRNATLAAMRTIKPAIEGGSVTAGNASQFSDGASACVVVNSRFAEQRNLVHIG